jgi:hypothetical protein
MYRAVTHAGTRSHLLRTKTTCSCAFFLPEIVKHRRAECAERVPHIEDVEMNAGIVDRYVELAVSASGGAFCIDRRDVIGVDCLESVFDGDAFVLGASAVFLVTRGIIGSGTSEFAGLFKGADGQMRTLALGLGTKGVAEWLVRDAV